MTDIAPIIVRSQVDDSAFVDNLALVEDAKLCTDAKVYKMARVRSSVMMNNTSVGDSSRLDYSTLHPFARIERFNHIFRSVIGPHSYTGPYTVMMHVKTGGFCSISWGVTIGPAEHDFSRISSHSFLYNPYDMLRGKDEESAYDRFATPCELGADVWIGTNATILRGVVIGHGAVIGANAVVNKDVPPYAIVAGVPAKIVKYRFNDETISAMLECRWWELPDEVIRANYELFKGSPTSEIIAKLADLHAKSKADAGPTG
jgi:acetyltransferase-like isoleucine patch superfamily enzyme